MHSICEREGRKEKNRVRMNWKEAVASRWHLRPSFPRSTLNPCCYMVLCRAWRTARQNSTAGTQLVRDPTLKQDAHTMYIVNLSLRLCKSYIVSSSTTRDDAVDIDSYKKAEQVCRRPLQAGNCERDDLDLRHSGWRAGRLAGCPRHGTTMTAMQYDGWGRCSLDCQNRANHRQYQGSPRYTHDWEVHRGVST